MKKMLFTTSIILMTLSTSCGKKSTEKAKDDVVDPVITPFVEPTAETKTEKITLGQEFKLDGELKVTASPNIYGIYNYTIKKHLEIELKEKTILKFVEVSKSNECAVGPDLRVGDQDNVLVKAYPAGEKLTKVFPGELPAGKYQIELAYFAVKEGCKINSIHQLTKVEPTTPVTTPNEPNLVGHWIFEDTNAEYTLEFTFNQQGEFISKTTIQNKIIEETISKLTKQNEGSFNSEVTKIVVLDPENPAKVGSFTSCIFKIENSTSLTIECNDSNILPANFTNDALILTKK